MAASHSDKDQLMPRRRWRPRAAASASGAPLSLANDTSGARDDAPVDVNGDEHPAAGGSVNADPVRFNDSMERGSLTPKVVQASGLTGSI